MKSWPWAIICFLLGYTIATAVGFALFAVHEVVMWFSLFSLMPIVFALLVDMYLRKTRVDPARSASETRKLIFCWIGLSFVWDALVCVLVLPVALGARPNWAFFVDQTPWIWIAYFMLILVGYAGNWIYRRRYKTRALLEPVFLRLVREAGRLRNRHHRDFARDCQFLIL
jgi:hypothetical protein